MATVAVTSYGRGGWFGHSGLNAHLEPARGAAAMSVQETPAAILARASALVDYLLAMRELADKPVRAVAADGLWQGWLPRHVDCVLGPDGGDDAWLRVGRPNPPPPPDVPSVLAPFVTWHRGDMPRLRPDGDAVPDADLVAAFEAWRDDEWTTWRRDAEPTEATRQLHDRLYDLRYRVDIDAARVELVWGHVVLDTVDDGGIRYPLVATPVAVEYDADAAYVRVVPQGAPRLQVEALLGWDGRRVADLQELGGTTGHLDIDVWDADQRRDFATRAMRRLGIDPIVRGADEPAPSDKHVHDTGVLFVRPRQRMTQRFLEQLRDRLAEPDAATSVGALAGILAHEPSRLTMPGDDADRWTPLGKRLLMPMLTNEAQESIARRLAVHRNVAVQGPPGTGKTHTIRNLICHLVAHGMRVLVLAQKEDPLRVLRDGLPEQIRPLCLAVLGRSADQLAQLQLAARELSDRAATLDPQTETDWVARLLGEIEQAEAQVADAITQMRCAAERESAIYRLDGDSLTASDVGAWLRRDAADGFIPDEITPGALIPVEPAELTTLFDLARGSSAADRAAARGQLPHNESLLPGDVVAAHAVMLRDAQKVVDALRDGGVAVDGVRAIGAQRIDELAREVRVAAEHIADRHGSWIDRLGQLVTEPTWRAVWDEHVTACERLQQQLGERTTLLAGRRVVVPAEHGAAPRRLLEQLATVRARFAARRTINRFTQADLAKLTTTCTVDGEPLRTVGDVDLAIAYVQRSQLRQELAIRWNEWASRVGAPMPAGNSTEPELWAGRLLSGAVDALDWDRVRWPRLHAELTTAWPGLGRNADAARLGELANALQECGSVFCVDQLGAERDAITEALAKLCAEPGASPIVTTARSAWLDADLTAWDACDDEIRRLWTLRDDAFRFADLHARLAEQAPRWAALIDRGEAIPGDATHAIRAWRWRQAQTWFDAVIGTVDTVALSHRVEQCRDRIRRLTADVVVARAWLEMSRTLDDRKKAALADWTAALRKIGKGTGKSAPHWQAVAQQAMAEAVTAVPVWIMSVDRAMEQFRAGEPLFDVVIVDEASQADIFALPALSLAHRAVVVGDDQQIGPQLVGVPVDRVNALIDAHLSDVPSRAHFDTDASLYDHAVRRSPERILLTEHFRSVPAIIEFSSRTYYDGKIEPLRTEHPAGLGQPVTAVHVPEGVRTALPDFGSVNVPEADALVERAVRIVADPAYRDKSIGVVSLLSGSGQATYIQHRLREAIGAQELERRSLRVGDPYTFQGDERDIILMSMVVSPQDTAIGAFTKRDFHRRINVAASRARDQMWLFHSVVAGDLPTDDARAQLLVHARQGLHATAVDVDTPSRCDNDFERAVLRALHARGLRPLVQFGLGRYRIDFVITAPDGRRLAIECDSDRFNTADAWAAERRRQAILERVGNATFVRLRSAVFHRAPDVALTPIWQRATDLGIALN
jgi:hypothetical protein